MHESKKLHTNSPGRTYLSPVQRPAHWCLVCSCSRRMTEALFLALPATFFPFADLRPLRSNYPSEKPAHTSPHDGLHGYGTYIDQVRSTDSQPSGTSGLPGYPHLISLPFLG